MLEYRHRNSLLRYVKSGTIRYIGACSKCKLLSGTANCGQYVVEVWTEKNGQKLSWLERCLTSWRTPSSATLISTAFNTQRPPSSYTQDHPALTRSTLRVDRSVSDQAMRLWSTVRTGSNHVTMHSGFSHGRDVLVALASSTCEPNSLTYLFQSVTSLSLCDTFLSTYALLRFFLIRTTQCQVVQTLKTENRVYIFITWRVGLFVCMFSKLSL